MSPEIRTIATGLNRLADKLNVLIQSEKDSAEKVKNAEIAALEAQLNPHFLYNSLDTINWMAIEQEQYPISNVVSALGKILRYGIDNSNGIVKMCIRDSGRRGSHLEVNLAISICCSVCQVNMQRFADIAALCDRIRMAAQCAVVSTQRDGRICCIPP